MVLTYLHFRILKFPLIPIDFPRSVEISNAITGMEQEVLLIHPQRLVPTKAPKRCNKGFNQQSAFTLW